MPVSGNYGTPGNPNGDIYSSYWELQWYSGSDPAHVEGDFWGRSDLTSGGKIATLRFDNGSTVVDIPLFPEATNPDSSSIKKKSNIQTPNGEAWMPILEGGGAYPYLGYQHAGVRHGVHDSRYVTPNSGVARWTFDNGDTDGSTAIDVWGDNDGVINGATTGVSGQYREAYDFDGTDDHVALPDLGLASSQPFSISAWGNLDTVSGEVIFGRYDGTDDNLVFYINNTSAIELNVGHAGGGNNLNANGGTVTTGTWHHFVGVYDSSGPTAEAYLDGASVATDTGTVDDFATADGPWIGQRTDGFAPADGVIDDVRLYNKALSSTEVSNLYNTGSISG